MFSTLKQKLLLGVYVFLIISIPVGSYLVSDSQSKNLKTSASNKTITREVDTTHLATDELKKLVEQNTKTLITPTPMKVSEDVLPVTASSFGPTLNLKLILEGRPTQKQAGKIFIGIATGTSLLSPKYLLSFTIDLPDSGIFEGLSLAGLTFDTEYTAYIKGPTQIATASAFIMSPSITNLNSNQPLTLLTGDLNEDNTINSADYTIVKNALGTKSGSSGWNDNLDLNKDGVINLIDLSIVNKNLGKVGASGIWISPPPASPSGALQGVGSASQSATPTGGVWLWIPGI